MILLSEYVGDNENYGYHITNNGAMDSICKKGLIPSIGERSKSAGDDIKGIFFFNNLDSVNEWIEKLYKDKDICDLELLRFNLENRKWIIRNSNEFYLMSKVSEDRIEYLRIYNKELKIFLPINLINMSINNTYLWYKLEDYKPLIRVKTK